MRMQVQKWGNSLALRIPKVLAAESRIEQGSEVELSLVKGRLVITPVPKEACSLADLLAGITAGNIHAEVDTGSAQGREVW
ncbi:MAG: AbrB/MazE/SpoVT family DNA-binding domain-containing protein [Candidatus Latescibacteria bacterium]|nr:AbrB/MazE/SpoVT family DNA-binding domain-containing protein [Candidatus Latescibacterota bacterium]